MSDTAETPKLQMTHDTSAEYPCTDIQPTLAKKKSKYLMHVLTIMDLLLGTMFQ